ncbi:Short transient receptor potential channel 2 [Triplophysa tibetana]|uniref:Short transient receptor potential channel 2 n=1 Tax=Triplophysa tibetana TaxID=1572043 RepID=A0A5A9PH11_9TELE|nr:Short transient receptor potential channel 2 [Triplophysa tibetana]
MQDRSGVLRVELQMERAAPIGFIDVGNFGSAFIQIDVGRSSWSLDHPYVTLLPTATLMTPAESRQGTGRQSVRMFKKADFLSPAAEESWDRLRVTCTQPFNKQLQFGLSFLRVRSTVNQTEDTSGQAPAPQNMRTPDKMTSVKQWLSSPAVQNTFFGRIAGDASPDYAKRSPEKSSGLSTSSEKARTPEEHKRKAQARQCLALKRTRPAASPTLKTISTSTTKGLRTEKRSSPCSQSPADMWGRASSSPQTSSDLISPETMCPLCGVSFSLAYLPLHASTCMDSDPAEFSGVLETAVVTSQSSSPVFGAGTDESMVPCPLCSVRFPPDCIQQHASTCGDTAESSVPEQWREIVNKKFRFPPELIGAIRERNIQMVSSLLKTGDGIIRQLDDSEDRLWREALNLSIRLGNEDTMDSLLQGIKFDFRQIHEALLVAVDTNQPRVVKRLLDRLDLEKGNKMDVRSFSMAIFDQSIDDSQFAPGVTPLTLACQKDLYEIVTMLKQKGHEIPWPHKISCSCLECTNGRQYDLLKFSLSRINTYRGIASRAYLSITSEDAMLSAFRLSRDLRKLSKKEPEFKPQYLSLEEICQQFAVELLGMCRNQSEVTTILNSCSHIDEDSEDEFDPQVFEEGIPNLARLRLAVNHNQKQFVAHPICQQVLSSIWCGSLSGWKGSRTTWKLLVSFVIFLTMPLLCLIYWIAPKSKLGKILKIPVIKFLLHSASYMWFLITLLGESIAMEIYRESFASRHQNILHNSFHMVWVVGFFWFECKEVWIEGLRCYFLDWWNCLDMMVLSMYLASFALRMVILLKGIFLCESPESQDECIYFTDTLRDRWHQEDPQFIAEVLFAVTSMLSFTRLAYILPAQESLGTLQISIGKMIDDMMRFMFILVIIGTAFLCGINNTYVPYVISPNLGRLNETFRFLFWTMFGVAEQTYVDMPEFALAEFVGRVLYGIYTLIIVIVLLNMLIAMITNSFQKIEDDADVEWKFARSKLYLSYFREGLTMPVPFNIIPSPKALFYLLRGTFRRICCCCLNSNSPPDYPPISSLDDKGTGEGRISYRHQVIRALVQRYIESARREFEETKRKGKAEKAFMLSDVGNRITELSKVVVRLHTEMKQINSGVLDYSSHTSAGPSEGSSFLGKYIVGAKNNFKDFSTERKPAPLTPVHHEEPEDEPEETARDGETTDESPACFTEADKESTGEQTSEGGIDNVIEEHTVDIDETDGNDEDVQIIVENNTDSEQTEDKNETVIDIETNTDTESESEKDSGGADETRMRDEGADNTKVLETNEGLETTDVNETEENEARTEMQENEDIEGNDGGLEDSNEGSQCEVSEEMSIDLNKGSLVTLLAKRIEKKLEMKDMKLIFCGKQASSSPTGSDVSHDTGFGSQFDLSANSPE